MSGNLGWLHVALHDFIDFLPPSTNAKNKFKIDVRFMTLGLYVLSQEYDLCIISTPLYSSNHMETKILFVGKYCLCITQ